MLKHSAESAILSAGRVSMQVVSSYGVHIRDSYDALKRTADLFSDAVAYLVRPALENWESLCEADGSQIR